MEGEPSGEDVHSAPVLPEDYRGEYISCIPRIPLPTGRFLFYTRADSALVDRLLSDARVGPAIIARSWSELFFGSYKFWDWVFDFELREFTAHGVVHTRRKLVDVTDEEIIGVYPPGVFSGDKVPDLPLPRFLVDKHVRFRDDIQLIRPVVEEITEQLVAYLAKHPDEMHQLKPRQFEELVCTILRRHGWDVELTPASKDGGYDIVGFSGSSGGVRTHWIIECKKWSAERRVGVEVVRGICGIKEQVKSANAMIVTTSSFTRGAQQFAHNRLDLDLRDYNAVVDWLASASDA